MGEEMAKGQRGTVTCKQGGGLVGGGQKEGEGTGKAAEYQGKGAGNEG